MLANILVVVVALLRTLVFGVVGIIVLLSMRLAGRDDATRARFIWQWAARHWARPILCSAGIVVEVRGIENVRRAGRSVITPNHQSLFDILVMVAYTPDARFVAKVEVLGYFIIGVIARLGGQVIIDREKRREAIGEILTGVAANNVPMICFPEGTRYREIGLFKRGGFVGAIDAQIPVVPTALSGVVDVLPPRANPLQLTRNRKVILEFGQPIYTVGMSINEASGLADIVRSQIIAMQAQHVLCAAPSG
ncbi:MAG: 1-acyl-sn-glycerol-3-phosphate acyltransferase [Patescibacteria group bacterium]